MLLKRIIAFLLPFALTTSGFAADRTRLSELPAPFQNAIKKLDTDESDIFALTDRLCREIADQFKLVDEDFLPDSKKALANNRITASQWAQLMSVVLSDVYGFQNRILPAQPNGPREPVLQVLADGEWRYVSSHLSRNFREYESYADGASNNQRRVVLAAAATALGAWSYFKYKGFLPTPSASVDRVVATASGSSAFSMFLDGVLAFFSELASMVPDPSSLFSSFTQNAGQSQGHGPAAPPLSWRAYMATPTPYLYLAFGGLEFYLLIKAFEAIRIWRIPPDVDHFQQALRSRAQESFEFEQDLRLLLSPQNRSMIAIAPRVMALVSNTPVPSIGERISKYLNKPTHKETIHDIHKLMVISNVLSYSLVGPRSFEMVLPQLRAVEDLFRHEPEVANQLRKLKATLKNSELIIDTRESCLRSDQRALREFLSKLPEPLRPLVTRRRNIKTLSKKELCEIQHRFDKKFSWLLESLYRIAAERHRYASKMLPFTQTLQEKANDAESWSQSPNAPVKNVFNRYERAADLKRLYLAEPQKSVEENIVQGSAFSISDREALPSDEDQEKGFSDSHLLVMFPIDGIESTWARYRCLTHLILNVLESGKDIEISVYPIVIVGSKPRTLDPIVFRLGNSESAFEELSLTLEKRGWDDDAANLLSVRLWLSEIISLIKMASPGRLHNARVNLVLIDPEMWLHSGDRENLQNACELLGPRFGLASFDCWIVRDVKHQVSKNYGATRDVYLLDYEVLRELEPQIEEERRQLGNLLKQRLSKAASHPAMETILKLFAGELEVLHGLPARERAIYDVVVNTALKANPTHYDPETVTIILNKMMSEFGK